MLPGEDEVVFDDIPVNEFLDVQDAALLDAERTVDYDEDDYREE